MSFKIDLNALTREQLNTIIQHLESCSDAMSATNNTLISMFNEMEGIPEKVVAAVNDWSNFNNEMNQRSAEFIGGVVGPKTTIN